MTDKLRYTRFWRLRPHRWLRLPRWRRSRGVPRSSGQVANRRAVLWLIGAAVGSAAVVAAVAFSGSYQHQYELNIRVGQARWVAAMQPISVEGLIFTATLALWFAALIGKRRRDIWPAYAVLVVGVGQAALMNLAADHRYAWPWLGPEVSVWPAVAFFAAYELGVWMIRNRPPHVEDLAEVPVPVTLPPPTYVPYRCDGCGAEYAAPQELVSCLLRHAVPTPPPTPPPPAPTPSAPLLPPAAGSKKAALLRLLHSEYPRGITRAQVAEVANVLGPRVELQSSSARSYLYQYLDGSTNGSGTVNGGLRTT